MVVFTPKSMLRRKEAASRPEDFTQGTFRSVIGDDSVDVSAVDTVLLCSGRITWDLVVERDKQQGDSRSTAVVRLEQLYPLTAQQLEQELARYPQLRTVRWVQDEPANMGPAPHLRLNVFPELDREVEVISRPASSSPSVGQHSRHTDELKGILSAAFAASQARAEESY
jgi:2-oxoglutarate decarboxylase